MTPEQRARALDIAAQIDRRDWPRSLLRVSTLSLLAEALITADRRVTQAEAERASAEQAVADVMTQCERLEAENTRLRDGT